MPTLPIVLLGSSRRDGETRRAITLAFGPSVRCIVLGDHHIGPFDYDHHNRADDFIGVIERLLPAPRIVFATPVYWYAMSGQMKLFFDRLSDLITVEKRLGRSLAGKSAWLLATGTAEALPEGFEIPFARTCAYFDMSYQGADYLRTGRDAPIGDDERQMAVFGQLVANDD